MEDVVMSSGEALSNVVRHLRSCDDTPDAELIARCATDRDETAFAAVIGRYGGLVLGVAGSATHRRSNEGVLP